MCYMHQEMFHNCQAFVLLQVQHAQLALSIERFGSSRYTITDDWLQIDLEIIG